MDIDTDSTISKIYEAEIGDIFKSTKEGVKLTVVIVKKGFPLEALVLHSQYSYHKQNNIYEFNPMCRDYWERLS